MQFAQPLFLIGYAAILIPILIHLFNLRRFKTYYFSNVRMLRDVAQKTKRESRVKNLIVLCLRCLAIIALVTAFARPYFPTQNDDKKAGNLVSIYLDNSFSMEGNTPNGTLFYDGVENARQIINNFDYTDQFILYNNDFSARQRLRLTKDEALQTLDEWAVSPNSRAWKELLTFEQNACTDVGNLNVLHYYISDFQKNNFDFSQFKHQDNSASFLVYKPAKEVNNVAIDSCWFLTPVFRQGQQATLSVRLRNCGDNDVIKLPLKLHVNGEQKAMAAVDIAAGSTAEYQLNYTLTSTGIQCGTLSIDDSPITFDNELYLTYRVSDNTHISLVEGNGHNRYLAALYGKDSTFNLSTMDAGRIDYSAFATSSVVILDQVKSVTSGLADELTKYLNNGGSVLVFPAEEMDLPSWNSFLANAGASTFSGLAQQEVKVGKINMESVYFKGSMENSNERFDMPTALKYFTFSNLHTDEMVMSLENNAPLLFVDRVGKGRLILSAVAAADSYGDIHKHALFFIPLHNIGIRALMQQKLYNTIGVEAQALIGNPPVLILDEPTVGLDPKQILEIRTLIKKLGKNHTVILSSHILSEIQAVCDRIIIINHGVVAAHDTTDNLSRNVSTDHRIIARIEGPRDEIVRALRNISGIKYVKADMEREPGVYEYELEAEPGSDIRRDLFHIAAENNWPLLSAKSAEMTLEDVFLKITMGEGIIIPNAEDEAEAKKGEKA